MTPAMRKYSEQMFEDGYSEFHMFPRCAKNRPKWKLVDMGLAEFDFGPRRSWLKTYCFMPVWSDPVC